MDAILWAEFCRYQLRRVEYKARHLLNQCDESLIWTKVGQSQAAIGHLILHICGSLDQWILAPVGKSHGKRKRILEFKPEVEVSKHELEIQLFEYLDECIECIRSIALQNPERIAESVRLATVQAPLGLSVMNCVSHAHGHILQMNTIAKILLDSAWIPDPSVNSDPLGGW